MDLKRLKEFVEPYYKNKDIMHDLTNIERVITTLDGLLKHINESIEYEDTIYAAYFHGFIYTDEKTIAEWLKEEGFEDWRIDKIIQITWESQKDESAETLEGRVLHDAHMIEGGKTFLITKSLITGSVRGQTLDETIAYIEENILGKGRCYFEKAKLIHKEAQEFAENLMKQIKDSLKGEL